MRPALLLLVILVALRFDDPGFVEELRLTSFDIEQRLAPRRQENAPVVIVEIDDQSLAPPNGQWPWPRTLVARLVRRIAEGKPSALGVDIIFSEPDRFSPEAMAAAVPELSGAVAQELAALPHNDAVLAAAFKSLPTVLGLGVTFETGALTGGRFTPTPIRAIGADPKQFLQNFPAMIRSLPEITAGESGRAALVGNPDRDGVLRRVPLFIVAGGNIVAGLSVETLRVALGARGLVIIASPHGIEGGRIADLDLPADGEGRAYPYFAPPQSSHIVSAAEVLQPSFDLRRLAGQIVLLGVTGLGLVDIKQTPLGLMQGIEVQAQLIESMLSNALLRRPQMLLWFEISLVLASGLIVIFALPFGRPRAATLGLGAVVVVCLAAGFILFRFAHVLLDGVYPSLAAALVFGVMLSSGLRAAEASKRKLSAELDRQTGELNAARAIQMGLLPRPMPETRALEVQPLIETARMVGGDLYDFVLLDPRHLFIAIADVSGKGVDAALFMAMTKMVLNAAALQHGAALDRVFGAANAKISAASDDIQEAGGRPMFVTVFAGILELDTGALVYASAGHDAPYVLRGNAAPLRLETEGGPPLGTLDEFDFPVDRAQLRPGDVILLYTDGVTEAKDKTAAFYTSERLDGVVASIVAANAKSVVAAVRGDLRRFVADAEQADDITLLAVRWREPDVVLTAP